MNVVEVRGLTVRYPGVGPAVFEGLDLEVARGQSVALVGPSGVGKSTLILHVVGLRRPEAGVVRLFGQPLAALAPAALDRLRARRVGFVFQRAHLLPHLTVRENVVLAARFTGGDPAAAWVRGQRLLEELGVPGLERRRADRLSVGQAQRVAVARALAGDPDLLVADEPTGALDRRTATAVADVLTAWLARGDRAAIVATHDSALADRFMWTRTLGT